MIGCKWTSGICFEPTITYPCFNLIVYLDESFAAIRSEPQLCLPIEGIFDLCILPSCSIDDSIHHNLLVYRVKNSNVILILQRSLCIKGAQRLFGQQLYSLLLTELQGKSVLLLTGASTEDVESASR